MTQVFVTRTGAKYHASYECPGILDAEAQHGRSIERWPTPLQNLHQEPCAICWPTTGSWDAWTQLEHRVEQAGGAEFERVFVRQVLRHVRDLRPFDVSVQRDATGISGKRYRLDFAIQGEGNLRVAVEIDGKNKAPGERSPDEVRRALETRRTDLFAAGWRVVNFGNERVANRSAECVVELESELREALRPLPRDSHPEPARAPSAPGATLPTVPESTAAPATAARGRWRLVWVAVVGAAVLIVAVGLWAVFKTDRGQEPQNPSGSECPSSAPVKGNLSGGGDKIFHEPGWTYYDKTTPEECFASVEDAEAAGYRPSAIQ